MPEGAAEHALMAARSRVLMDPRAEAWKHLQNYDAGARELRVGDGSSKGFEQLGARYASALASIKMRDFDRAENALRSAELTLQLIGNDERAARMLRYLRAELAQARGKAADGFAALRPLAAEKSRALLMQQASLAMVDPNLASAREAAEALQTFVSVYPMDASAWTHLGQLWTRLDQPLRSLRAQGEARAAMGDLNGAIDRLRSGLRQSRGRDADQIEAAVIDSRLRTLSYQRRQMLEDLYPRGVPPGAELPN